MNVLNRQVLLISLITALVIFSYGYSSYTVTNLNTTILLNKNNTAQVTELINIVITNSSVSQYETDRVALNLTLSSWQILIGPVLVQHLLNPRSSVQNFKFLPGPLVPTYGGDGKAVLLMLYSVNNITTEQQIAPRTFLYTFNSSVLNFEHTQSGEVLPKNTTMSIILPSGSEVKSVYPTPDAPAGSFINGYKNVTELSWFSGEPLSKFALTYETKESLGTEAIGFFENLYKVFGIFSYVIVILAIAALLLYLYIKATR